MLTFLPAPVRGAIAFTIYIAYTVALAAVFFVFAFIKLMPVPALRYGCTRILNGIGDMWVICSNAVLRLTNRARWDIRGIEGLHIQKWCLLISNHQSWADILVLCRVFSTRIPPYKFFIKKELLWLPIMGWTFWSLDFPIMKRYSREFLEQNPHLKGKDLETTRKSCEKFKRVPVSVFNFVEGTRFTCRKHQRQQSPFAHLLKPKAGGTAIVVYAMGAYLQDLIDVTIAYPDGVPGLWEFLCGRVGRIQVDVKVSKIPEDLKGGNYFEDPDFRSRFQAWLNDIWVEKDRNLSELLGEASEDEICRN